ncbi:MAG: glycine--tRNA ligase subunit beta, partial [Actinomycetota bacterium]|nr:glycine--tRNA ligase subunit beta [Actinomycetota bacterium]
MGCEELPAASVYEAEAQLAILCEQHLGAAPDRVFVGPRRLAVLVRGLEEPTEDELVKGPPVSLRERAADGFARRHGVAREDLVERDGFLGVLRPAQPLAETVPERLDAILRGLAFGKTMRWDDSGLRFARPVRWTCARLDGDALRGHGTTTHGHRFTHGEIDVPDAEAYAETLRAADVEPEAAERERIIRDGLDALGEWADPLGKLREVVHLVEKPVVLQASFDERFLQLPTRIVETAMQSHQRYFPLGGNRFALVANGGDADIVRVGNENVLEGRLDDATFTFERDVAVGIDELARRLDSIVYFAGAGSFAEKTDRLVKLVDRLGGGEASLEAARLAKADQAAELVREFPELEGYIGGEYARVAGYPEAVCTAIGEQYLPEGAGTPLPSTEPGRVLSAADKIDALTVSFALGHRPTGSRDPYGLRRAAIGLCRLAVDGGLTIPRELLEEEVAEFVEERFEALADAPVE